MSYLDPRTVLPPIQSSSMMDDLSPLTADPQRVSFRNAITEPVQRIFSNGGQAARNIKAQIQVKAPGFFRKNAQLMLISVLVLVLSILCVLRVKNDKSLPASVTMMISTMVLYFVWKYSHSLSASEAAYAGWLFALILFISIVIMWVWVEKNK